MFGGLTGSVAMKCYCRDARDDGVRRRKKRRRRKYACSAAIKIYSVFFWQTPSQEAFKMESGFALMSATKCRTEEATQAAEVAPATSAITVRGSPLLKFSLGVFPGNYCSVTCCECGVIPLLSGSIYRAPVVAKPLPNLDRETPPFPAHDADALRLVRQANRGRAGRPRLAHVT